MTDIDTNVLRRDDRANIFAIPTVRFLNTTSSGLVKNSDGTVHGVLVNSHTSGTIRLFDGTTASGTSVMGTYSFTAGSQVVNFGVGIKCDTGIFATVGGTANITILYN